jgi:TnpA family transposase
MPVNFLSESERLRLSQFPRDISKADLIQYFRLTQDDLNLIQRQRRNFNRLGFAVQLCALRYLGYCPDDLQQTPPEILAFIAKQLDASVKVEDLSHYGKRSQTRTEHFQQVQDHLGFRSLKPKDFRNIEKWLMERALEHDKTFLLFELVAQKLHREKLVRPGVSVVERWVGTARHQATEATYKLARPLLRTHNRKFLDRLLEKDSDLNQTPLHWLRLSAVSNTPSEILNGIKKVEFLRTQRIHQWDVSKFNPNRLKLLARIAKKSGNHALKRSPPEKRYPTMIAFAHQSLIEATDESADLFIRCLGDIYSKAQRDLRDFRQREAVAINEKVMILKQLGQVVLDPEIQDPKVQPDIFERIPRQQLELAIEDCERLARPLKDESYDFFAQRYSYIRQFAPAFLRTFVFRSNHADEPLLKAIELLRQLNETGHREVPESAPLGFVGAAWKPFITNAAGQIQRRYYELCVLWTLRQALRSGNIWIEGSRRYADPRTYLIPKQKWQEIQAETYSMLALPEKGIRQLKDLGVQLDEELEKFSITLQGKANVRIEEERLVISPLEATEESDHLKTLKSLIDQCLPRIDLTDLLMEVDCLTHFSDALVHSGGNQSRSDQTRVHLYASILSQACNIGPTAMARAADLSYDSLLWHTTWYLDDTTLPNANTILVNAHHRLPLAQAWGGGTLSSSDGQRFPVAVKNAKAVPLPRYFGYGKGVTFYTWISDQFSQYGNKVIPSTQRDAPFVLDGIRDNETELSILEHTTDTAGFTEVVFAIFDLLGLRFSPRLRDLASQQLYRLKRKPLDPLIKPFFKGRINRKLIQENWDDMVRVVGSIQRGWVSASLFMSKLQSFSEPNRLFEAFQEYGRLVKTIFILRYLNSEDYQRRIKTQLNKGESMHSLREFISIARQGQLRRHHHEELANQSGCLTLVTNAIVLWNTIYIQAALDHLKQQGYEVNPEDIPHLSPCRFEHINPYGKMRFDIDQIISLKGLRPLRPLKSVKK